MRHLASMGKPYMAATAVCVVIALALRSASVPKISGASWKDAETWLRQWPDVLVSPRAGLDVSSASLSGSTCNCKAPNTVAAACQLSGPVRDCCCDYASVEQVNRDTLNPLLKSLTGTAFMRYFKTTLYCDCPLWPDDGMCAMRDCSVCECEDDEVPAPWKLAERGHVKVACQASGAPDVAVAESAVDRHVEAGVRARLQSIPDWRGLNNPWMPNDEEEVQYSYINLQQNPERFTGYQGESATRIWEAIYSQSCFTNISDPDTCTERRVFYRLISGMHSSISAHIAADYLLNASTGAWGRNLALFEQRLGNPDVRERVENLYFTYLFTLRALQKAGPLLDQLEYDTGMPAEDQRTKELVHRLVNSEALRKACPIPFHEGRLWKSADAADLKRQLQTHFRNITSIMDCVGCEKCKLWGKLQLLGIATSLKILFHDDGCDGLPPSDLVLERNEVIALVNLLERLSNSIEIVRSMSLELLDQQLPGEHTAGLGAIETVTDSKPLFEPYPFAAA